MKKILFVICFLGAMLFANKANARGLIVYSMGAKVSTAARLPAEVTTDSGKHLNLGVMYNQFSLFWLPIWNWGTPKYVLVSEDEKLYWEIDDDELNSIKEEYKESLKDLPEKPSISLWQQIGGKPIILLLLGFLIWGQIGGKKKDDDDIPVAPTTNGQTTENPK